MQLRLHVAIALCATASAAYVSAYVGGTTPATSRHAAVALRATAPPPSLPSLDPFATLQKLASPEAAELARELAELSLQQDPQVVLKRSLDLARALNTVGAEAVSGGSLPDPAAAPKLLRRLCEELGATYVKLGQFVASSPTLFPELWVREFEKTLDDVPPVAFSVIKGVVERELGSPLEVTFAKFDRAPLAAASIAQVHRATLRDEFGGGDVVVKVLRPGVDDLLKADLGFLEIAGKAAETLVPSFGRLSLANVLEDLRATMLDELDLEKEAANLEVFRAWLATAGLEATATCPLPVKAASSKRVLTMDYVDGVPLTDLDALRAMYGPTFDAETTLLNALNTWSLGVLSCDFFHADVHAGNLLALRDGRVAFLDFGIVGRVPERIWTSLQDAAAGLASRDFELLARALTTMGAAESVDERAFAADLEALFKSLDEVQPDVLVSADGAGAVAATVSVDDAQVTDLLLQVVNVTERNGIKLPREFGLLVKQALYFDRYTRLLAPDMDVINDDRVAFSAQLS